MSDPTGRSWVFTLDDFTPEDINRLTTPKEEVTVLVFRKETHPSGKPFLGGVISFSSRKREAQVKATISLRTRCNTTKYTSRCIEHCKKDDNFFEVEEGRPTKCPASLPDNSNADTKPTLQAWQGMKQRVLIMKCPQCDLSMYMQRKGLFCEKIKCEVYPSGHLIVSPLEDHPSIRESKTWKTIQAHLSDDHPPTERPNQPPFSPITASIDKVLPESTHQTPSLT